MSDGEMEMYESLYEYVYSSYRYQEWTVPVGVAVAVAVRGVRGVRGMKREGDASCGWRWMTGQMYDQRDAAQRSDRVAPRLVKVAEVKEVKVNEAIR